MNRQVVLDAVEKAVYNASYDKNIADVLNRLLIHMFNKAWCGACHPTSAVLFFSLSELGYHPVPCIGEAYCPGYGYFDHSWILLDNKVIDLACVAGCNGEIIDNPVIFNLDCFSGNPCKIRYGIYYCGLDDDAKKISNIPLTEWMDGDNSYEKGLWTVVQFIMRKSVDIEKMRKEYQNVMWKYICDGTI